MIRQTESTALKIIFSSMSFLDLALSLAISGLSIQFDESFSLESHL
jgi:hypothetical protein